MILSVQKLLELYPWQPFILQVQSSLLPLNSLQFPHVPTTCCGVKIHLFYCSNEKMWCSQRDFSMRSLLRKSSLYRCLFMSFGWKTKRQLIVWFATTSVREQMIIQWLWVFQLRLLAKVNRLWNKLIIDMPKPKVSTLMLFNDYEQVYNAI